MFLTLKNESTKELCLAFPKYDSIINAKEMYRGQFLVGKKHGFALQVLRSGEIYIGCFKDNKKDGKGIHFKLDETILIGEWKNNKLYHDFLNIRGYKGVPDNIKLNSMMDNILKLQCTLLYSKSQVDLDPKSQYVDETSIEF